MIRSPGDAPLGPIVTAMVTPFDASGRLDVAGAQRLARHLVEHGSDALVVTGTTGEVSTLTDDERVALWEAVRAEVDCPVVAGSTSNDTAHSIELTKRASTTGVDAILAVTPYYSRPSQAGIEAHFRAVASATDLPVYCYDIPIRTGRAIGPDVMLRLAEVGNIVGVKDAAGDPAATARLLAEAPEDFCCYSGDDGLTLPLIAVGAVGAISVASHWCGEAIASMIACYTRGDTDGARRWNAALSESFSSISFDDAPNPLPAKAALDVLGLPAGPCRLPLGPMPEGLTKRIERMLDRLGTNISTIERCD